MFQQKLRNHNINKGTQKHKTAVTKILNMKELERMAALDFGSIGEISLASPPIFGKERLTDSIGASWVSADRTTWFRIGKRATWPSESRKKIGFTGFILA